VSGPTPPESSPPSFGTVQDAARILKRSPDRVRQLHRTGALSAIRTISGVRLFDMREVAQLAAKRRRAAR
jgi:hypothetical protein